MAATKSPAESEAEVIRDLLQEIVYLRRKLDAVEVDNRTYKEMVQLASDQLHKALELQRRQRLVRQMERDRKDAERLAEHARRRASAYGLAMAAGGAS